MDPGIGRDLPLPGQPDQVHRRRVARRGAGSAFQRCLQLPDRRLARPADTSSGRLARVSQRWHITSSQPYPPLRHCAMVGEGCAGPPKPSICSDHSRHSAASASRIALLARSRACCALILAPLTRSPKIRCRLRPPICPLSAPAAVPRNATRNCGWERRVTPPVPDRVSAQESYFVGTINPHWP